MKSLQFEVRYTTTTKSYSLLDYNELKLVWRVPLGTYELSHCSTKKLSLTQAQLNGLFEFFAHAKKKHEEFLKVGPWRTEVLTVYGKSGGNEAEVNSELNVIAQEDENTSQLYITVSKAGDCSITVSTSEADKLLSCAGKMSRIKKDEDYQPGQTHSSVLDAAASANAAAASSAINPRGSGSASGAARASDDAPTAASTGLTHAAANAASASLARSRGGGGSSSGSSSGRGEREQRSGGGSSGGEKHRSKSSSSASSSSGSGSSGGRSSSRRDESSGSSHHYNANAGKTELIFKF